MKAPQRTEDYLKTIYMLSATRDVRAFRVAESLGLSRPTVSVALKRMERQGYLAIREDNSIDLTELGLSVARTVYERYLTIRELLISLGVDEREADRDACSLEHGLGETSYQALKRLIRERRRFCTE